jgi:hypothetical protein
MTKSSAVGRTFLWWDPFQEPFTANRLMKVGDQRRIEGTSLLSTKKKTNLGDPKEEKWLVLGKR